MSVGEEVITSVSEADCVAICGAAEVTLQIEKRVFNVLSAVLNSPMMVAAAGGIAVSPIPTMYMICLTVLPAARTDMIAGYGPSPKNATEGSRGVAKGTTLLPRLWIRDCPHPLCKMQNWRAASAARKPTKMDVPKGEGPLLLRST